MTMLNTSEYESAFTLARRLLHRPTPCSTTPDDPSPNPPHQPPDYPPHPSPPPPEEEEESEPDDDDEDTTPPKCPFVTMAVCSTSSAFFSQEQPRHAHPAREHLPPPHHPKPPPPPHATHTAEPPPPKDDPSFLLYYSVLRSCPPITGNYHSPSAALPHSPGGSATTKSTFLSSAQVLEGYMAQIQIQLGIAPERERSPPSSFDYLFEAAGMVPPPPPPTAAASRRRRGGNTRRRRRGGNSRAARTASSAPAKAALPPDTIPATTATTTPHIPLTPSETEIYHTISSLTSIVLSPTPSPPTPPTPTCYPTATHAKTALTNLGRSIPRRVCQHPFKRHDIVWVCRTCQSDETCVLCHECFSASNHEGHDVAFYHAQAGGCCDCGDPDAWDPKGFCPRHGGGGGGEGGVGLGEDVEARVRGVVVACSEWLEGMLGRNVERGYERGKGIVRMEGVVDGVFSPVAASTSKSRMVKASFSGESCSPKGDLEDVLMLDIAVTDPPPSQGEQRVFSPERASTSKSRSPPRPHTKKQLSPPLQLTTTTTTTPTSPLQQLGQLGSQQHGLYIVLHADDIHSVSQISTALRSLYLSSSNSRPGTSSTTTNDIQPPFIPIFSPQQLGNHIPPHNQHQYLQQHHHNQNNNPRNQRQLEEVTYQIAHLFRHNSLGDLILYGTHELLAELGPVLSQCWKDGDERACIRFGALIMEKARVLVSDHGLMVSIKTGVELWMEVRAKSVVEFLGMLSQSCDPLCGQVSSGLGGDAAVKTTGGDVSVDLTAGDVKPSSTTGRITNHNDGDYGMIRNTDGSSSLPSPPPPSPPPPPPNPDKGYLISMLQSDLKLPQSITTSWHALLLTLLAVPNFKAVLANAYCDTYKRVTSEYARGVGILEKSSYTLSVQFLNRVTYVQDLVRERDLLGCLGQSLLETLTVAKMVEGGGEGDSGEDEFVFPVKNPVLDPMHIVLSHRRYSPCISDLKCVLNVPGMGRLFSSILPPTYSCTTRNAQGEQQLLPFPKRKRGGDGRCSLDAWIESLSLGQNMDRQRWRSFTSNHVETEPKGWVGAFNASISLGSLFERLLNWEDTDEVPITEKPQTTIPSSALFTACDLTHYVLTHGLTRWQNNEILRRTSTLPPQPQPKPTPLHHHMVPPDITKATRSPEISRTASLPMSTVAVRNGCCLCMKAMPVSQGDPWSFHLPLHRFVAACLREVARRPEEVGGIEDLLGKLMLPVVGKGGDDNGKGNDNYAVEEEESVEVLFQGLMEFPLIVLSRAAQIRSSLWRRNGSAMFDQVLNYAEPPFCRALRDADLMLIQFALIGFHRLASVSSPRSPQSPNISSAHFINLLLHRLGIFEFTGLTPAPPTDVSRYQSEINAGLYDAEREVTTEEEIPSSTTTNTNNIGTTPGCTTTTPTITLPWVYSITEDVETCLSLFEEVLHALIVIITELPSPPTNNATVADEYNDDEMVNHTSQAKARLRREVVHRLVSGAKTHSELAEVHHVLPLRDNSVLSEEGKLVNPDDATGAALEAALREVATRCSSRGRLEPDKWELRSSAWEEYDPAFFHISLRNHQNAAENRPTKRGERGTGVGDGMGGTGNAVPYAPYFPQAHKSFRRLRRDITSDSTVVALLYRTLHVHCRSVDSCVGKDIAGLTGSASYGELAKSETVLARAIHLLTLGAYAWDNPPKSPTSTQNPQSTPNSDWRSTGGGSPGSIFHNHTSPPTSSSWIKLFLLAPPQTLLHSNWYNGEQPLLLLLHRLAQPPFASDDGSRPTFHTQDPAIRNGAKWLCDWARGKDEVAERILRSDRMEQTGRDCVGQGGKVGETDLQRRSRLAREREMKKMQKQMADFAKMFGEEDGFDDDDGEEKNIKDLGSTSLATMMMTDTAINPMMEESASSMNTLESDGSAPQQLPIQSCSPDGPSSPTDSIILDSSTARPASASSTSSTNSCHQETRPNIPLHRRLLTSDLRCIICAEDFQTTSTTTTTQQVPSSSSHHNRNPSFGTESAAPLSPSSRSNDKILAFCGYAQASTVLKDGGGIPAPFAQPSASLLGTHVSLCGHVMHTSCLESHLKDLTQRNDRFSDRVEGGKRGDFQCPMCRQLSNCLIPCINVTADWLMDPATSTITTTGKDDTRKEDRASLHSYLDTTRWWTTRNDPTVIWNNRCAFLRKGVRPVGKKDLYIAWTNAMKSPRPFLRKRKGSPDSSLLPSSPIPTVNDGRRGSGVSQGLSPLVVGMEQATTATTATPESLPISSSQQISVVTDVWRRVMDQFADVSYKADLKRLGEARLQQNYGEFRHYLVEKVVFNSENRSGGGDVVDWPECILPHVRNRRQELSRERLISKLLQSIQSFTYSCCAEEAECKRLSNKSFINTSPTTTAAKSETHRSSSYLSNLFSRYGVHRLTHDGRFLILSPPLNDNTPSQFVFGGRIGRLRYLALAVMAATGVVSREIVQLSLDLPITLHDGNERENKSETGATEERAPLVFPILCGHVLTHLVAAMCAVCGEERVEKNSVVGVVADSARDVADGDSNSVGNGVVEDCERFIQLGFIARVLQVLLGCFQGTLIEFTTGCELKISRVLSRLLDKRIDGGLVHELSLWEEGCCRLLQVALRNTEAVSVDSQASHLSHDEDTKLFFAASQKARDAAFSFLCNVGVILQVIAPSKISAFIDSTQEKCSNDSLNSLMSLFGIEPLRECMNSLLVQSIVNHWYTRARPDIRRTDRLKQLNCASTFTVNDWPLVKYEDNTVPKFTKYISLLGGVSNAGVESRLNRAHIKQLPISYTDLYAELTSLLPDSERTAVCLVCGEVLDAGKGSCTKHGFECGGGSGIFFLLQDCIGLILHKEKAAYVHSPYVDSHGETPQYRGKRLNLELSRYNILHELWCGHTLRQEVISERSKNRSFLPNNFF